MHELDALTNRLRKTARARRSWAKRQGIEAYRVYEIDIPELPYIVDMYGEKAVVYDRTRDLRADEEEAAAPGESSGDTSRAVLEAVGKGLGLPLAQLHFKERRRMPGSQQYQRLANTGQLEPVREHKLNLLVNLTDYLDTGLFLDHRPMRRKLADGMGGARVLNLFCYTGSVSVAAAVGGAHVTSVDLSNTYLGWAEKNFTANGLDPLAHQFIRADALDWLSAGPEPRRGLYDFVFLDPPTFSNSKMMRGSFDVQRDHLWLIEQTLRFVAPGGTLFFSTNRRRFALDKALEQRYQVTETSHETVPEDFRDRKAHRSFLLRP